MKRLLSVVLITTALALAVNTKAEAQSAAGTGPWTIYHVDYKGVNQTVYAVWAPVGVVCKFLFSLTQQEAFMAIGGVYKRPPMRKENFEDEVYVDDRFQLHIPSGARVTDDDGNDVTFEFSFDLEFD